MQTGKLTLEKSSGVWKAWQPDGTPLSLAGTQTDGLQEGFNYAVKNNCELESIGGGTTTHFCTAPVNIPPAERLIARIGANVDFSSNVAYALTFNSLLHSHIRFLGEIYYRSTNGGAGIAFSPQAGTQELIVDNDIAIRRLLAENCAENPSGILFSCNQGTIARNRFHFLESEGGYGSAGGSCIGDGITVWTPLGGYLFEGNEIDIRALLIWSGKAVSIGQNTTAAIFGNIWNVHAENSASQASGIETYATKDYYRIRCSGNVTTPFTDHGSANYVVYLS